MKFIFSHMVDIVIWIVALFTISLVALGGVKISNASDFRNQVIDRIETSYYSDEVIQECYDKANEYGYDLSIQDVSIYDDRKDILVSVTYTINIPLFNLNTSSTVVGYAR